jgi:hypothetical protein
MTRYRYKKRFEVRAHDLFAVISPNLGLPRYYVVGTYRWRWLATLHATPPVLGFWGFTVAEVWV